MECQPPEEGNFDSLDLARAARCRVILWDESHNIQQKISTIIQSAGAEPVLIKDNSDLQVVKCCPECTVAVLVAGQGADQDRMQVIRDLKTRGFKVIACGEGAGSWPIRSKCLALLAGAVQLLDSASSDFSSSLRQLVERIVRAEMQKRSEEQEIAASMRRLGMVAKSSARLDMVFGKASNGYIADDGDGIDSTQPVIKLQPGPNDIWQSDVLPNFSTFEGAPYMYRVTNAIL